MGKVESISQRRNVGVDVVELGAAALSVVARSQALGGGLGCRTRGKCGQRPAKFERRFERWSRRWPTPLPYAAATPQGSARFRAHVTHCAWLPAQVGTNPE